MPRGSVRERVVDVQPPRQDLCVRPLAKLVHRGHSMLRWHRLLAGVWRMMGLSSGTGQSRRSWISPWASMSAMEAQASHTQVRQHFARGSRPAFYRVLRALVGAGYGDRIMFGSDQMVWPGLIDAAVRSLQRSTFLTVRQRRDIFYNNAAPFLRLPDSTIARHHGKSITVTPH